jgi:MFS family permease
MNRRFYGWVAISGSALTGMVASASFYNAFGVFLPVMCLEFGWSRAIFASGLTLGTICLGFPSPLIGMLVARFGPRKMLFFGNLLFAICLATMSQVHEVWQVFILYCIGGFGAGCGGFVPSATIASNWFIKKRALAQGVSAGIMGLGPFLIPPILSVFIISLGWRSSWLTLSGMVFLFSCIIGPLVLVRNKPEDVGQAPDGTLVDSVRTTKTINQYELDQDKEKWTVKQVMKQPATWLIGVFMITNAFAAGTLNTHQVAHIEDLGFSPMMAAFTVSAVSIAAVVGSLGFGGLATKFSIKKLVSAAFAIRLIALIILMTTNNIAMLYVYAVFFGISGALISTATVTLVGNYYGRARFPQIMGMVVVLMYISLAAGPAFGGAMFDATGSYTTAFIILSVFTAIGLLCALFARPPQPKNT